jgi:hypothetical protein
MLFKSGRRQYCYIKPRQALNDHFVKKNIKHSRGNLIVWGCIMGWGMGRLHCTEGIMCRPDYIEILDKDYLSTLKDLKLRQTRKEGVLFQQDNDQKHWSKVAKDWFWKKNVKCLLWPPSSPNMNIIEHIWDQLDALVLVPAKSLRTLQNIIHVACISNLVKLMQTVCKWKNHRFLTSVNFWK